MLRAAPALRAARPVVPAPRDGIVRPRSSPAAAPISGPCLQLFGKCTAPSGGTAEAYRRYWVL